MKKLFFIPLFALLMVFMGASEPLSPKNNAIWHNSQGVEYIKQGDPYSAIAEYKIAIALNPKSSAASAFYNNLGLAYMQLHQPSWAATCFENAIELNPNCFYYYENLIKAYAGAGRLNQQYLYFKKQAAANFENSYNWMMLGLIQTQKKEYKNAIKSYSNFILLDPELIITRTLRSKIEELQRRPM